jgi:hypothetical protein
MQPVSVRYRRLAWTAWRGLALLASLWLSQRMPGMVPVPPALAGAALAVWLLIGWDASRPAVAGAATAALTLAAAVFAWRLPWAAGWFAPIWAALFWLPALLRMGVGPSAAAFSWLAARYRKPAAWMARFPRTLEALRVAAACGAGLIAMFPFLHDGILGGADARWYTSVVADHLEQWRLGLGPVFVGQTRFAAIGTVMPLRIAPYLQHLTLAIDLLTGRTLSAYLVLNLSIALSGVAGCLSAYLCLGTVLPSRRTEALLLAVLYLWCPAVVGLAYTGQLFMSVMTLPFLPLVFAGVVRIFERDGFSGWGMAAAGCAACWLAHTPIGLWVSISAALALAWRWATGSGWNRMEARRALGAALLFGGLCGYVFVSLAVLAPPAMQTTPYLAIPPVLKAMFPAVLKPVSQTAGQGSDLQPGWSLLAALLAASAAAWSRRMKAATALSILSLVLLCLTLPVPGVNGWLWRVMPTSIVNVTNAVPTQRLYPILAACIAALAASALATFPRRRGWSLLALAIGVAWSGIELRPFLRRGSLITNTKAGSEELMSANNLVPSVFSLGGLADINDFFSYGFMDFELEQRVLAADLNTYVVTNVEAVAPGFGFGRHPGRRQLPGVFSGTLAPAGRRWIDLGPSITVQPGRHYLLAIDFPDDGYQGVLQVQGPGINHEYKLPISGRWFAFGAGVESSRVIPLYGASKEPAELKLDFVVEDPGADLGRYRVFARYELIPYDPRDLPIRLKSLLPYTAQVRTPAPGWLESFRYYTKGWTATVNGRPAAVIQSKHGLVAVPVEAGESEVRLEYRPPAALLASYWLMGAAWVALAAVAAASLMRRDFHGKSA